MSEAHRLDCTYSTARRIRMDGTDLGEIVMRPCNCGVIVPQHLADAVEDALRGDSSDAPTRDGT